MFLAGCQDIKPFTSYEPPFEEFTQKNKVAFVKDDVKSLIGRSQNKKPLVKFLMSQH